MCELNQLLQLGFWKTSGVYFGTNNSGPIQISELKKTDFCSSFVERMMLCDLDKKDNTHRVDTLVINYLKKILKKLKEVYL